MFQWIEPRLIISAHTHHFCHHTHSDGTSEWTVPSFSWRNKPNPSFLLVNGFFSRYYKLLNSVNSLAYSFLWQSRNIYCASGMLKSFSSMSLYHSLLLFLILYLQMSVSNNNYAINKCYLPQESTVIYTYIVGGFCIVIRFLLPWSLFSSPGGRSRSNKKLWHLYCSVKT